jgi:hypothetical protein
VLTDYGVDPRITNLLDTHTLYVRPKFNPDGADVALSTIHNPRSTPRPYDEDGDGLLDEDPPNDLDGDGFAQGASGTAATRHTVEYVLRITGDRPSVVVTVSSEKGGVVRETISLSANRTR